MTALPLLAEKPNPHFERFGAAAAVQRLVDAVYGAMDTRPEAVLGAALRLAARANVAAHVRKV